MFRDRSAIPGSHPTLGPALVRRYARGMCGRVRLSSAVSEIKLVFSIPPHRPNPNIAPSWNVAPTDPLPIVRYDVKAGERSLDVMRWGLVPFWAKDIKVGFSNINAKAEGIEGKPAFREAFQRRDGIIVSNHGGRVVDSGAGTIEVLPEIIKAVGGRMPVLVDSGFRRGTDIIKALAMGAQAVCIGRPYLWGLGAFGQPGVERVLEILRN